MAKDAATKADSSEENAAATKTDSIVAAELRRQVPGRMKGFYAPRGYWPLWIHDGDIGPQAADFLALIEDARIDGLNPKDYDPVDLHKLIDGAKTGGPPALARAEIKLSTSFAAYVRDMRRAPTAQITYLDPELEPHRLAPDEVLRLAALAPSFPSYVKSVGWMSPLYLHLRDGLARLHTRWADLPAVDIPPGAALRAGDKGLRVKLLRRRLGLPEGTTFDKALGAKLRLFEADHGLPQDGIASDKVLAALARPAADYEQVARQNLDRARLLPGPWTRHIVVDAAAARLTLYDHGKAEASMKVVVGDPETPTPMLAGMVRYAILNPYWNVPTDLVQKRIAPKVLAGASLKDMRYQALADWSSNAAPLDPAQIDWKAVADGREELRLRQLPGGKNAMGRVKFMFPNNLGIYLHDTPNKELFAKPIRTFSNGCVRLENAALVGKWLFGKPLLTTTDAPEQDVPLPTPVPVYLSYFTVDASDSGINFLYDPYGRDEHPIRGAPPKVNADIPPAQSALVKGASARSRPKRATTKGIAGKRTAPSPTKQTRRD